MRKNATLLLVLVFLSAPFTIVAKPVTGAVMSENAWESKAPMHVARGGLGVAVVNGKIYAIGGSTESGQVANVASPAITSGFVGTNEEYDPTKDTWTFKASMPTPRARFAISVYQGKVYCIGGAVGYSRSSGNEITGANEVYDTATDTWETKAPIPTARDVLQANVVGGKIYLIGGYPNNTLNEVYDPATDSWTTKAPLPTGVSDYVSAVVDNKIYIMGGYAHEQVTFSRLTQIYVAESDMWSIGKPSPLAIVGGSGGATSGAMALKRIYVLGTVINSPHADQPPFANQAYDPVIDSWAVGAVMPTNSRQNFGVAVVNDTLYAIGGHNYPNAFLGFFTPSAVNEAYAPIGYGTPDPDYQPPTPSPSPCPTVSPSPSPSTSPTQPPESHPQLPNPELVYAPIAATFITIAAVAAVAFRKRHNKHRFN